MKAVAPTLLGLVLSLPLDVMADPSRWPTELPKGEEALVDVLPLHPAFLLDLRYATSDNFFGQAVYETELCALRKTVAERMVKAQRWLDREHPGLRLLFKDCYRPDRVQWIMWKSVKGTKKQGYVADPSTPTGSIHSYGAAVDLTLADAKGRELDMGTPYDHLGRLAQPRYEERHLASGELSPAQVENRKILRAAMLRTGMKMIRNEWWHFNADGPQAIRRKYKRLDVPLSALRAEEDGKR